MGGVFSHFEDLIKEVRVTDPKTECQMCFLEFSVVKRLYSHTLPVSEGILISSWCSPLIDNMKNSFPACSYLACKECWMGYFKKLAKNALEIETKNITAKISKDLYPRLCPIDCKDFPKKQFIKIYCRWKLTVDKIINPLQKDVELTEL